MFDRPLHLYNSLGRELQEFEPRIAGRVGLYTCGLTVYNYAHIGNLRAYLFTDTLRRVLQWKGYDVHHVMNITDVGHLTSDADEGDDKMELAAERRGKTVWEIAAYYTEEFEKDLTALAVQPPSVWCKATDHIQEMISFAQRIEGNGLAYALDDGLYLDTSKVSDYGKLAMLDLEGQQEGARVDSKEGKRNASDFVVWRRSPEDSKRLMEWHSPWGVGAPGWHLECSVMSLKYLGESFDIHTGGIDHRQVHHCNEIAQNEAFLGAGEAAVRYWLHNEFLTFGEEAEKMSKSTGRFLRLATLVDWGIHPLVYRHFVLMATYRRPLEFSFEALVAAKSGLGRILRRIAALQEEARGEESLAESPAESLPESLALADEARFSQGGPFSYPLTELSDALSEAGRGYVDRLDEAVSRDLNTPQALALLNDLLDDSALPAADRLRLVAIFDLVLGLRLLSISVADLNLRPVSASVEAADIDQLLVERREAREAKDFARADALRDEIQGHGVALHDSREGTAWEWIPKNG